VKLSVIMPVYNEVASIEAIVAKVLASDRVLELIIVDDASADGSREILDRLEGRDARIHRCRHPINRGKGAAVRTGLPHCHADAVVIQDADLEYDPADYEALLAPLIAGEADVVYGSRYLDRARRPPQRWSYRLANRLLTALANRATGLALTDMETCYKCFRREVIQQLPLEQERFGIEVELTARAAQMGCRIVEVGIGYEGRGRVQGKKIGVVDGLEALYCIFKYRGSARAASGRR
jgi:glycosyltransferase involved in cell wall biosynthesis